MNSNTSTFPIFIDDITSEQNVTFLLLDTIRPIWPAFYDRVTFMTS